MSFAAITTPFRTTPWRHQMYEFEHHAETFARALFWQPRTGKTKLIIDTACHLYEKDEIDAVMIFAPNGVHRNWIAREVPIHCWDFMPWAGLTWTASTCGDNAPVGSRSRWFDEFNKTLRAKEMLWIAFNYESMIRPDVRKLVKRLQKTRRLMVVFDESHAFRTPGSKRTMMARALAKKAPYRRILTGTPVDNSPRHAYSQFELLEPGALGFTRIADFEDRYLIHEQRKGRDGNSYPALVGYRDLDDLRERMAAFTSTVRRADCDDLPDLDYEKLETGLSAPQRELYDRIREGLLVELEDEQLPITNRISAIVKMQQVASGFIIDMYKRVHVVDRHPPKLQRLLSELEHDPDHTIIWCRFKHEIGQLVELLHHPERIVVEYHGGASTDQREKALAALDPRADPDRQTVLVGQFQAGGQGLDLSAAGRVIWYSHTFDAILRNQAVERATAMGGANVRITDLVAAPVEQYILSKLQEKADTTEMLTGEGFVDMLNRRPG